MKWITDRPKSAAFASLFLVALILTALMPNEVMSQANRLYRATVVNILKVGDNATIEPSNDGSSSVGTTTKRFGVVYADSGTVDHFRLGSVIGGANGTTLMKVANVSGSALAAGDALVWDLQTVAVTSGDVLAGTANVTVSEDLTTESANGAYFSLVAISDGTAAADTVHIYGSDENGSSQNQRMELTDGSNTTSMIVNGTTRLYWSDIDSISFGDVDGSDSVSVVAYPYSAVMASDGANTDFAGVAFEAIADNGVGYAVVHGPVDAVVDAASNAASPGSMVELASGGDFVTDTGATTAKNGARAMEYSNKDGFKIRVFVDSY